METQGFSENRFRESRDAAVYAREAELHRILIRMLLVFWHRVYLVQTNNCPTHQPRDNTANTPNSPNTPEVAQELIGGRYVVKRRDSVG
jgi:hypothetical protein